MYPGSNRINSKIKKLGITYLYYHLDDVVMSFFNKKQEKNTGNYLEKTGDWNLKNKVMTIRFICWIFFYTFRGSVNPLLFEYIKTFSKFFTMCWSRTIGSDMLKSCKIERFIGFSVKMIVHTFFSSAIIVSRSAPSAVLFSTCCPELPL